MRGVALLMMLALAALSGCVEPIEGTDLEPLAGEAEAAAQALDDARDAPGHLAGVVRDAAGQPIEGASVTIDGLVLVRTSDADGSYAFIDLAAGAAVVRAAAEGFETASREVVVLPGQVTHADVGLAALPPTPRYDVLVFDGDSDLAGLQCWCSWSFESQDGLLQVILEAVVDEGMFTANDEVRYSIAVYDSDNSTAVSDVAGSPLRAVLDTSSLRANETLDGYVTVRPSSSLLYPELSRGITTYVTLVYDAVAPEGYTARPATA